MATINTNIKLPTTTTKTVGNGNTTIKLPSTNGNNTTIPVGATTLQPLTVNTGNIYSDYLTPTNNLTTPVYSPVLTGGVSVKTPDMSQYFDSSVVGTANGGFSSGGGKNVTDEGVITTTPNADNVTFNSNVGTGNSSSSVKTGTSASTVYADGLKLLNADSSEIINASTTETGTGTGVSTETEDTPLMTYEEYFAMEKQRLEDERQAALKDAEIYKERAAADAQASYMQNMSTYGVNAETMAQMGLTGGGYSDYLNAQAYAQKRSDMQTADANKISLEKQAQSTYSEGMSTLNGQYVAYKEAEREYAQSIYNTLWEAVQDTNTNYTAESVRAIAEKAGISEEDITTLTGMLETTLVKKTEEEQKAADEQAAAEEEQKATYSAGLKSDALAQIEANGGMSVEYINSLKGYGLSDEDLAEVVAYNQKYTYNSYKSAITGGYTVNTSDIDTAYSDGLLDETQYNSLKTEWNKSIDTSTAFFKYNGETISYDDAKTALNAVLGNSWTSEDTKNALQSSFKRTYATDIAKTLVDSDLVESKTVDIFGASYKPSNWGDFNDINDADSGQGKYIKALEKAVKEGKIKEGQLIAANYGAVWDDCGIFVYIGDGVFVEYDYGDEPKDDVKALMYFPDGYKYRGKWKTGYVTEK